MSAVGDDHGGARTALNARAGTGRILTIDCATPALSLALFEGGTCLAAHHEAIGRGHAEALLPAIAALPGGGRCDRILVDVGPGSFTGVRVGIAAAVALGFAWSVPVAGFGCLDLVGAMARDELGLSGDVAVVMIGGHGELFWAIARPGEIAPVRSTPVATLAGLIDAPLVVGSGAAQLVAVRGHGEAHALLPDARQVPLLAPVQRACPARPVYGRGADAKPMAAAGQN